MTDNGSPVDSPKRLSASERRSAIIDAARDIFLTRGLASTRARDIAEAAGVTESLLYRYFDSKEEIFAGAVLEELEGLLAGLQQEVDAERYRLLQHFHEHLLRVMIDTFPFLTVGLFSGGEQGKVFYSERLYPLLRTAIDTAYQMLPGWKPDESITPAIYGMHFSVILNATLREQDIDIPDVAAQLTELVYFGMRDNPGPSKVSATSVNGKGKGPRKGSGARRSD
jgi:AcrR family transcriptional regulator